MSILLSKLFKTSSQFSLAIIQYERAGFSVGHEEELHWAVVAVYSKTDFDVKGHAWQVVDRHYSDGRPNPVQWLLHYGDMQLNKTLKCLGGVYVGQMNGKDVDRLNKLIHDSAQPVPKFEGWNCRDWVLEVIRDILVPNGWADAGITTQQSLLPSLRSAAQASCRAREAQKRATPHVVPLQLPESGA
ncbi:hypothetical protein HDZ31DRAFT_69713 [Schizophyllum fasciatum]